MVHSLGEASSGFAFALALALPFFLRPANPESKAEPAACVDRGIDL